MKYLTTAEAAHALRVSKQTLLNWLYRGKVPEPPRGRNGYRLWSAARVEHIRGLMADGRLHSRTVVHHDPVNRPGVVAQLAREVDQFLREATIDPESFLRELARQNRTVAQALARARVPLRTPPPARKTERPARRRARA